jgi:hypothetical protein
MLCDVNVYRHIILLNIFSAHGWSETPWHLVCHQPPLCLQHQECTMLEPWQRPHREGLILWRRLQFWLFDWWVSFSVHTFQISVEYDTLPNTMFHESTYLRNRFWCGNGAKLTWLIIILLFRSTGLCWVRHVKTRAFCCLTLITESCSKQNRRHTLTVWTASGIPLPSHPVLQFFFHILSFLSLQIPWSANICDVFRWYDCRSLGCTTHEEQSEDPTRSFQLG